MISGVYKKLAKARGVANGAGFLLQKLEAKFGDEFGEGLRTQVRQAINECRQQGSAIMAITAKTAVEAERMHEKKSKAIAKATGGAA